MDNQHRFRSCFEDWVALQHQDLDQLLHGLTINHTDTDHLRKLTQTIIKHFQDYTDSRADLAQFDASSLLCPSWCSSFEKCYLWIGGCRPSLIFRLVYAVCGSQFEAQLDEILEGKRKDNLGDLSAKQLESINMLHLRTLKEEDKLSSRMATLQEDIADHPLVKIANESGRVGESSEEVERALEAHSVALAQILVGADKLRLGTLKELIEILSPLQAVDLLVASEKLHLSMHGWGKNRDLSMGK